MPQFNGAGLQFNLGEGRTVEVELNALGEPWLAVARDIEAASIWMEHVTEGGFKLRVRIKRTLNGLRVSLDTDLADKQGWWAAEACPSLSVEVDEDDVARVEALAAPIENAKSRQLFLLGTCQIHEEPESSES